MPIPAFLAGLFKPALDIVDHVVTREEDRGKMRLALAEAQIGLGTAMLDYESKIVDAQSKVVLAEASGQSWMQRNWRPVLMLTIVTIVAWNYLFVDAFQWLIAARHWTVQVPPRLELPDRLFSLMEIGVGGYVVGRSAEKIAGTLTSKGISFRKDEPTPTQDS